MEVRLEVPPWATHLLSDLHDWKRRPLPVGEVAPFAIPDDAWFEYAWLDAEGTMRADPGGVGAGNPWWPAACVITGPEHRLHPGVPSAEATSRSRLERVRLTSRFLGQDRWHFVYSTGDGDGPRPVVYTQDGKAFWHWGRVGPLVDRATDAGELPSAHYVFVQPEQRSRDYAFHEPFRSYVLEELLPAVEDARSCDGRRVLMGASLGALASADLALARPDLFGSVVSLSGAFLIAPGDDPIDPYAGGEWLRSRLQAGDGAHVRWRLECGTLEWLIGAHRRLAAVLADRRLDHVCVERAYGHNWSHWRQALPEALRWALG